MSSLANIELYAQEASSYDCFKEIDLLKIKDRLADILSHLRDNGSFKEYTQHDISHIDGMLKILEYLIPDKTKKIMHPADWMMLVLSVYFHDYGMLVTQDEISNRNLDEAFLEYKETYYGMDNNSITEDELYENYVRIHHADRIYDWLNIIAKEEECPAQYEAAVELLKGMLGSLDANILKSLAMLCKSHQQKMDEVFCLFRDKVDYPFSMAQETEANLLYVASLLRTADLLHINSERTPLVAMRIISPQNSYSKTEWDFQKSITRIRPKKEVNRDGKIDASIPLHTIEVIGSFKDEFAYQRLKKYLDYAEKELCETFKYCRISQEDNSNEYSFPWDSISRDSIDTEGFYAKPVRFELDKKNILQLLVGHTLYNNPNVVLRELTQNSIDACRLMNTCNKEGSNVYEPKVKITWDSNNRYLKVQDNGTGMTDDIILNYLVKVGVSRYQSESFKKENPGFHSISRFGIGLLTCFMISDQIEMYSLWKGNEKAYKLRISEVSNDYILRNDSDTDEILEGKHGTTFILKVHEDVDFSNVLYSLKKWIVVPQCNVEYIEDGVSTIIGYNSEEDALRQYMNSVGLKIDDQVFRLRQKKSNGYTICCVEKKNEYMGEWSLFTLEGRGHSDIFLPLGTCVEGIMVSTTTPGFISKMYLALVNCTGINAPNTNVARDQLEESLELDKLNKFIYKFYLSLIDEKVNALEKEYSLPWAVKMSDKYIDSFLALSNRDIESFEDYKLFNSCLAEMKCFLVDKDNKYYHLALNELGDEVWTIDSYAFNSAMHLSQELTNCEVTALNILDNLDSRYGLQGKNVLSVIDSTHYTYDLFTDKYEISAINIDKINRKIEYRWSLKCGRWHKIDLYDYYYENALRKVFIAKELSENNFAESVGSHYVKSKFGLLILPGCQFCTYLCSLIEQDSNIPFRCTETICSNFVRAVSDNDVFSVDSFFRFLEDDIPIDLQDFYEFVDKDRLKGILQNEKVEILSLDKFYNS